MRTGKSVILAMATVIMSFGYAWAQTNQTTLAPSELDSPVYQGTVIDGTTGVTIPNASITVCSMQDSHRCTKTTADFTGQFSLIILGKHTDDYEVTVSKGGYVDASSPPVRFQPMDRKSILQQPALRLVAMATVSGEVFDAHGKPAVNALVALRSTSGPSNIETSVTDSKGRFRVRVFPGSYSACARPEYELKRSWDVPTSPLSVVPVSACFSSLPRSESASTLQLNPGDSVGPLRISLREERAYSVRGLVRILVTKAADWTEDVYAVPSSPRALVPGAEIAEYDYFPGRIDVRSGRFSIHGLKAGAYSIVARSGPQLQSDTGPMPPQFEDWRQIRMTREVTGLILTIRPHVTVTGKVIRLGNVSTSALSVLLDSCLPPGFGFAGGRGEIDSDGQFRIPGVSPGDYEINVDTTDKAVYVAALRQHGRNIAARSVRIPPVRTTNLEIRLRKSTAAIRIKLLGEPVDTDGSVLSATAIPEGAWDNPGDWITRWISVSHKEGTIGPLVPGKYLVFLTQNLGDQTMAVWQDELKLHEKDAVRVVVKDGTTEVVSIRSVFLNAGLP